MRIGCLQFAPHLGDINQNLNRADAVLNKANVKDLDLLVLPELAFSGYNFKSLKDINPFFEPTAAGISSLWARTTALKYNTAVVVGYPEKVDVSIKWPCSPEYYNAAIIVNEDGETIGHYRKTHLYYTDETWALEGPEGFFGADLPGLGGVAMGICMDINPYKFEARWTDWEFAHHVLHRGANLVILSMAWLTRENYNLYSRTPREPDLDTLGYWIARLEPLIRDEEEGEIIVVIANRAGVEDDAVYAGTSCVLGIENGEVKLYGVLGRGERELLVVDTSQPPQAKLVHENYAGESSANTTESSGSKNNESDITDPDEYYPSIDEMLHTAPISPVGAKSPHPFFSGSNSDLDERQILHSSITHTSDGSEDFAEEWTSHTEVLRSSNLDSFQALRSAVNGTGRFRDTTTPGLDDSHERPSSPKSRNASRNRHFNQQEPALHGHDLADGYTEITRATNRNELVSKSAQDNRPVVAVNPPIMYPQYEIDSDDEIVEIIDLKEGVTETVVNNTGLMPYREMGRITMRPKSTGW